MTLQALTANRLIDGQVVYLTADGRWSEQLAESRIAADKEEAEELLAIGAAAAGARIIVDPYLFVVSVEGDIVQPLGQRETIRAKGPSVRTDLGYQAAGG